MIWQKEKGIEDNKNLDYMILVTIVFFLIGVVFKHVLLFAIIGILLGYYTITKIYDHYIGKKLGIHNPHKTVRLFPGDEADLIIEIYNKTQIPYVNGLFRFQTDANIQIEHENANIHRHDQFIEIPLSALGNRKSIIKLPIKATHRGTTKVKNIQYEFPHLLSFSMVTLRYIPYYNTEFVIYPESLPVQGVESYFQLKSGEQQTLFSPFEDILSPYGTRSYQYSDPFHRINWKASAKTQHLQTNVYDPIIDMSLLIIVNLGTTRGTNMTQINPNMEKLLSYTAYLGNYATESGTPYEMIVNVRKPGKTPYITLPKGMEHEHYAKTLEMLARIPKQPLIVPMNQVLHQTLKQMHEPQTIIIVGEIPPAIHSLLSEWKHVQQNMFYIESDDNGATMHQWTKAVNRHAT